MRTRIEMTISSKKEWARGCIVKCREVGEKVARGELSRDAWTETGRQCQRSSDGRL